MSEEFVQILEAAGRKEAEQSFVAYLEERVRRRSAQWQGLRYYGAEHLPRFDGPFEAGQK